ncbi:uncharacterized protein A4U43_C01F27370 [Asparagus officinalis]|uniref:BHLH domain-containing protein n=1 Tax=Asparagus officinalis TaxID=4686 RepID=A0A5P1FT61_ASPOF|nr:uncharacterized protein A4U43_C01F27370 [Asparagus officinalis]
MQDMMMHCLNPSVLERQRAHLQWQDAHNLNACENFSSLHEQSEGLIDHCWPNLNASTNTPSPATTMCNSSSSAKVGKEKSSKKRKADKSPVVSGDDEEEKRPKGDRENKVEKRKENKREDSGTTGSKENNDKKQDYIHVRARRGQATDSHSLAERVRRERISERMKYLQGLVPGCNKITGKAGMLDEIINYVQSLQRQVEMNLSYNSSIGMESEIIDPSFLQFNVLQQAITSCGYDMGVSMNPTELALQRSISPPANEPPPFLDSNFNVPRSNPGWDNELHNLYGSAFPFLSLQGNHLSGNLKTEM